MIVELGLIAGLYATRRVYEESRRSRRTYLIARGQLCQTTKLSPSKRSSQNAIVIQRTAFDKAQAKTKETNHYLAVSFVHIALAFFRQVALPFSTLPYLLVFSYHCFPLFRRTERLLVEKGSVGVDSLTATSVLVGLVAQQYVPISIGAFCYFLSEKFILMTKHYSRKVLNSTLENIPQTVRCVRKGQESVLSLQSVLLGDQIIVSVGNVIPVDGVIVEGSSMIDERSFTGESQPAEKGSGERVYASTVVISGRIVVETDRMGRDTMAAKVEDILALAGQFKNQAQLTGEKWADVGVKPTFALFLVTSAIFGATSGLVVLAAHFGRRIRILAPMSTFAHIKEASRKGIVIKNGRALEELMHVDTFLFDKTGTLTTNTLEVTRVVAMEGQTENEIIQLAAAAEADLKHPIARAIQLTAEQQGLSIPDTEFARYQVGFGVGIRLAGREVLVGSKRFLSQENIEIPVELTQLTERSYRSGFSIVFVTQDSKVLGAIELRSLVRSEAKTVITQLRKLGAKHISIVSGDHEAPTQRLAASLETDDYFAQVLPEEKATLVERLQREGRKVCFIGDGLNDAIAMKTADVSVSLAGASEIAVDSADIVLMGGDLRRFPEMVRIAKRLDKTMNQSLAICFLPSAVNLLGLYFLGISYSAAVLLKNTAFVFGLGNVVRPVVRANASLAAPNQGFVRR